MIVPKARAGKDPGHCPRCNDKALEETENDITCLNGIGEVKGAMMYECESCKSVWYKHPSHATAIGYEAAFKDYLVEWGSRDMKPTRAMKTVLHDVGNVSAEKHYELYPVDVVFRDGSEFEPAIIRLGTEPPSQRRFNKRGWHYLDTVKEIRASPFAYPHGIGKLIMKTMLKGTRLVYVKSVQTKKVYAFEAHAGVFMPRELKGQDFELVTNGKEQEGARQYFMPADRGGSDIWTMTETTAVQIWGDKP